MMRGLGLLTFARKLDEAGRSARLVLNPRHPFTTTEPWNPIQQLRRKQHLPYGQGLKQLLTEYWQCKA